MQILERRKEKGEFNDCKRVTLREGVRPPRQGKVSSILTLLAMPLIPPLKKGGRGDL